MRHGGERGVRTGPNRDGKGPSRRQSLKFESWHVSALLVLSHMVAKGHRTTECCFASEAAPRFVA